MRLDSRQIIRFFGIIILSMFSGIVLINLAGSLFIREIVAPADGITASGEETRETDRAPYFEVFNTKWDKLDSTDIMGKPAVILFWNSWNSEAEYEFKVFNGLLDNEVADGVRIIAINSQEDRTFIRNFIKRGGYKLDTYLDENGSVGEKFNAYVLPQIFFIDKNGIIKEISFGPLGEREVVDKLRGIVGN